MSRPRFLADEDLRFEIVLAVRRLEPAVEIVTIVEAGQSGADDAQVLESARQSHRIVVSHDVNTLRAEAERRIVDGAVLMVFSWPRSTMSPAMLRNRSCLRGQRPRRRSGLTAWSSFHSEQSHS